jgi:hypothetical protein
MGSNEVIFLKHQPAEFDAILGSNSSERRISILADESLADLPLYHEAGVYHLLINSIFITLNQLLNQSAVPPTKPSNRRQEY